jgi:hypothetical protein
VACFTVIHLATQLVRPGTQRGTQIGDVAARKPQEGLTSDDLPHW